MSEQHWDRSRPFHQSAGHADEPDFLLTHALWWPFGAEGRGCPETGVRDKSKPGSFHLIQHGWPNFAAAEALILRALRKGWDADRIGTLMGWMFDRYRYLRVVRPAPAPSDQSNGGK